jgi:hypothetical protein
MSLHSAPQPGRRVVDRLQDQGSIWVMTANGSGKRRVFNGANGVQPANRLARRAS